MVNQTTKSAPMPGGKFERQRKFLTVMPLLVIPFLTLFLWVLGVVGTPKPVNAHRKEIALNFTLPRSLGSADSNWNKLAYYNQAQKETEKYRALQRTDQRLSDSTDDHKEQASIEGRNNPDGYEYDPSTPESQVKTSPFESETEDKSKAIYNRLEALKRELNQPETNKQMPVPTKSAVPGGGSATLADSNPELSRLEQMIQDNGQKGNEPDPEMQQLNTMLDKVLDIQHPKRLEDQLRQQSEQHAGEVFPVNKTDDNGQVSLLDSRGLPDDDNARSLDNPYPSKNAFYGLKDADYDDSLREAIPAIIQETQTLVSGATVKLRLSSDVFIHGLAIPKGHLIYGKASLNGERLMISVTSIAADANILPVSLAVYDMDGQPGIYIPGALSRDVLKQSSGEGIQSMNVGSFDPSLGAQAASAGIQAAKTLLGKKIRLVKVTLSAGYQVWLVDQNQKK